MNKILKVSILILSLVGVLFMVGQTPIAFAASDSTQASVASNKGHAIFSNNCEACHTIGNGDAVGPDLKGVTSRRDEAWLRGNIQHPSQMIAKKDPIAMQLLAKYGSPMDDLGLSDEDVDEVIKYLKSVSTVSGIVEAGVPVAKEKVIKKEATKQEISQGRALFQGNQRFLREGPSCISCHDVRSSSVFAGGALAKDLTKVYSKLSDTGLSAILKKPSFPVMRAAYKDKDLTSEEINDLVAFLENVDKEQGNQNSTDYRQKMLLLGLEGAVILFVLYFVYWSNGKRKSGGAS